MDRMKQDPTSGGPVGGHMPGRGRPRETRALGKKCCWRFLHFPLRLAAARALPSLERSGGSRARLLRERADPAERRSRQQENLKA